MRRGNGDFAGPPRQMLGVGDPGMLKTIAIGLASIVGVSVPAYAADLGGGSIKDAPVAYGPQHSWAGLYVGGSAGYGSGELDRTRTQDVVWGMGNVTQSFRGESSRDLDGAIYGAHIGYNWQFGHIVAGLEASINGTDIEDCSGICNEGGIDTRTELEWYSTAVARLGYAEGGWLLYGFGGLAWGSAKTDAKDNLPVIDFPSGPRPPERISDIGGGGTEHVGWTAGLGVEYAFSDRLSLRAEYSHVSLGEESLSLGSFTDAVSMNHISDKVGIEFDAVKIGASYKLFGPDGAVEPLK
jgi:outer membrane immunogenic protein